MEEYQQIRFKKIDKICHSLQQQINDKYIEEEQFPYSKEWERLTDHRGKVWINSFYLCNPKKKSEHQTYAYNILLSCLDLLVDSKEDPIIAEQVRQIMQMIL
jgi:hypothetical protein